jgi:hypothetical protein
MKFVNRGYMLVKPTKLFIDWAKEKDETSFLSLEFSEGNIYLIEEDFMDEEPLLKANFKVIFHNEFESVEENEAEWPCECKIENFEMYFTVEFGSSIFDLHKSDLKAD